MKGEATTGLVNMEKSAEGSELTWHHKKQFWECQLTGRKWRRTSLNKQ